MSNNQALTPVPQVSSIDHVAATPSDVAALRSDLSGPAKAAIIVRFLLNEGADVAIEDLPDPLQGRLADQMARMGLVTRDTLASVVQEFAEALDGIGLTFPNDLSGALTALDGKISPHTAHRLRKEAGVRLYGDPWSRLREQEVEDLIPIIEAESIEVSAVLLSKLDVEKAALLLNALPGPLARRVAYAVSQTGQVSPEAVDRIGLSLASQVDLKPATAFGQSPEDRLGAILNQSAPQTRDDMLTSLDETDVPFATAVRSKIFTFADIPLRIEPRDVAKIIKEVEQDTLVTALAAATEPDMAATSEFLLGNMSSRMADNLREEITERGAVRQADGEAAMTAITAAIRRLEVGGELVMKRPDEDEE
ncbi:MAG: flagellar motor switch protein FliG [Paracoccaceae bacterium]